jgi:hypothetical protein
MPKNSTIKITLSLIALLALQGASNAQNTQQHQEGMDHSQMTSNSQASLPVATEGGQGGFTAIAEIVALLQADPNTDWSKVNINVLREHLVDMNELTMHAKATSQSSEGTVKFIITAESRAIKAVHMMVPAHAGVLSDTTNWKVKAELTDVGAIMTLRTDNPNELQKINALGFFGIMATGAQHQEHHVLMATGAADAHRH